MQPLFFKALIKITCLGVQALELDRPGFNSQYFQLPTIGKLHMISKAQVPQLKNDVTTALTL